MPGGTRLMIQFLKGITLSFRPTPSVGGRGDINLRRPPREVEAYYRVLAGTYIDKMSMLIIN